MSSRSGYPHRHRTAPASPRKSSLWCLGHPSSGSGKLEAVTERHPPDPTKETRGRSAASARRRAPGEPEGQSPASSGAVVGIRGKDVRAGRGEGPVLTGHIGHLYLQALDVSHVHVEEGLGLRNGAPDARQGDVGQTAAAIHCGTGGGREEQEGREEECAPPPRQPAGHPSKQAASKDAGEASPRAVLEPESPRGSGLLRGWGRATSLSGPTAEPDLQGHQRRLTTANRRFPVFTSRGLA